MVHKGDAYNPEWGEAGRVHDWRNYINDTLRAMWATFTPEQRQAIADNADNIADCEQWN